MGQIEPGLDMVNRKQIPLGYYDKLEDAIDARKVGEEKYFRSKQEKVDAIKRRNVQVTGLFFFFKLNNKP